MRCPTVCSMPASQKGKPGFFTGLAPVGRSGAAVARMAGSVSTTLRSTRATLPSGVLSGASLGTMATAPGMGAMALPGSGTRAGMGVPTTISPSGRERARAAVAPGKAIAAGVPSWSAKGVAWNAPALTASGVPASNTSWLRQSSHIPCAKCG